MFMVALFIITKAVSNHNVLPLVGRRQTVVCLYAGRPLSTKASVLLTPQQHRGLCTRHSQRTQPDSQGPHRGRLRWARHSRTGALMEGRGGGPQVFPVVMKAGAKQQRAPVITQVYLTHTYTQTINMCTLKYTVKMKLSKDLILINPQDLSNPLPVTELCFIYTQ